MPPRSLPFSIAFLFFAGSLDAQVALDRPSHPAPASTVLLATGFDFPVGKPDATGYYKARGFSLGNHPGEDWDGIGGGDSDLNDPVDSIADGEVVFAEDARLGWGNVIIVRHQFLENGEVKTVDAFYAHLSTMFVRPGQRIKRGDEIGTVGTAHGRYEAHLHFELRKNLAIGINRAAYPCDFTCYYDPTKFIKAHRRITADGMTASLAAGVQSDLEVRDGAPSARNLGGLRRPTAH